MSSSSHSTNGSSSQLHAKSFTSPNLNSPQLNHTFSFPKSLLHPLPSSKHHLSDKSPNPSRPNTPSILHIPRFSTSTPKSIVSKAKSKHSASYSLSSNSSFVNLRSHHENYCQDLGFDIEPGLYRTMSLSPSLPALSGTNQPQSITNLTLNSTKNQDELMTKVHWIINNSEIQAYLTDLKVRPAFVPPETVHSTLRTRVHNLREKYNREKLRYKEKLLNSNANVAFLKQKSTLQRKISSRKKKVFRKLNDVGGKLAEEFISSSSSSTQIERKLEHPSSPNLDLRGRSKFLPPSSSNYTTEHSRQDYTKGSQYQPYKNKNGQDTNSLLMSPSATSTHSNEHVNGTESSVSFTKRKSGTFSRNPLTDSEFSSSVISLSSSASSVSLGSLQGSDSESDVSFADSVDSGSDTESFFNFESDSTLSGGAASHEAEDLRKYKEEEQSMYSNLAAEELLTLLMSSANFIPPLCIPATTTKVDENQPNTVSAETKYSIQQPKPIKKYLHHSNKEAKKSQDKEASKKKDKKLKTKTTDKVKRLLQKHNNKSSDRSASKNDYPNGYTSSSSSMSSNTNKLETSKSNASISSHSSAFSHLSFISHSQTNAVDSPSSSFSGTNLLSKASRSTSPLYISSHIKSHHDDHPSSPTSMSSPPTSPFLSHASSFTHPISSPESRVIPNSSSTSSASSSKKGHKKHSQNQSITSIASALSSSSSESQPESVSTANQQSSIYTESTSANEASPPNNPVGVVTTNQTVTINDVLKKEKSPVTATVAQFNFTQDRKPSITDTIRSVESYNSTASTISANQTLQEIQTVESNITSKDAPSATAAQQFKSTSSLVFEATPSSDALYISTGPETSSSSSTRTATIKNADIRKSLLGSLKTSDVSIGSSDKESSASLRSPINITGNKPSSSITLLNDSSRDDVTQTEIIKARDSNLTLRLSEPARFEYHEQFMSLFNLKFDSFSLTNKPSGGETYDSKDQGSHFLDFFKCSNPSLSQLSDKEIVERPQYQEVTEQLECEKRFNEFNESNTFSIYKHDPIFRLQGQLQHFPEEKPISKGNQKHDSPKLYFKDTCEKHKVKPTIKPFRDIVIDPKFPYSFINMDTIVNEVFDGNFSEFIRSSFKVSATPIFSTSDKSNEETLQIELKIQEFRNYYDMVTEEIKIDNIQKHKRHHHERFKALFTHHPSRSSSTYSLDEEYDDICIPAPNLDEAIELECPLKSITGVNNTHVIDVGAIQIRDISPYRCILGMDWLTTLCKEI